MDGYRSPPPPGQPPPLYDSDPRIGHPIVHNYLETQSERPRGSSVVGSDDGMHELPRYVQPHRPINEAVSSAFDKADASNYVPPELIAQITQTVIQQLKTTGLDSATPVPQTQYPPPPPPPAHIVHPIPLTPSSSPPVQGNVYTPPSPHKHFDYPSYASPPSHQPMPPAPPQIPHESTMSQYVDKRPLSPQSQSSESSNLRPKGPERLSTGNEETTLERIWGQLFNEDCQPTARLGQFLRGLAIHIIDDYEPCHSIVITPAKMVKYYEDVKLSSELYPWSVVFDDEHSSISRMYRDLECQHHLVQERNDLRPDIPGLTPVGFERWVTLLIQAHPEEEYKRLQKTVLDMPISNPDDKKERFPKEISRRLFPSLEDRKTRDRLEKSMSEHAKIEIPRQPNLDPPTINRAESITITDPNYILPNLDRERKPSYRPEANLNIDPSYVPPASERERKQSHRSEADIVEESSYIPPSLERERKPYSNIPTESAIDDTNPVPSVPQPIERERKPYTSQPGGGRKHEDDLRAREGGKGGRSDSAARARTIPVGSSTPRPTDAAVPDLHPLSRASTNARRHRSPSFSAANNDFRRSDSDVRGYHPTMQSSSIPNSEGFEEDPRRYVREADIKRGDRARRVAEEDTRGYSESPNTRTRYDRDGNAPTRGSSIHEDDYYRGGGRATGNGYDYSQAYGGSTYR